MYFNTPAIFRGAIVYGNNEVMKQDITMQKWVKRGMAILSLGFIIQLIASFL